MLGFGFEVGAALLALFACGLRGGAAGVVAGDGGDVRGVDVEDGGGMVVGVFDLREGGGASGWWEGLVSRGIWFVEVEGLWRGFMVLCWGGCHGVCVSRD